MAYVFSINFDFCCAFINLWNKYQIRLEIVCRCCSAHEMGTGTRESSPGGCLCDHQRDPNDETADGLCQICSEAPIASAVNTNDADTDSFTPRVRSDKRSVTILLGKPHNRVRCVIPWHRQHESHETVPYCVNLLFSSTMFIFILCLILRLK